MIYEILISVILQMSLGEGYFLRSCSSLYTRAFDPLILLMPTLRICHVFGKRGILAVDWGTWALLQLTVG